MPGNSMGVGPSGRQVEACPRISVAKVKKLIPAHFIERLEQDQKLQSCCRHPENHDIVALKSNADEKAPDIYKFICTCGRIHTRFCASGGDVRPVWQVR